MALNAAIVYVRKNGIGVLSVGFNQGQTGIFESTQAAVFFVPADEINYSSVTSGTSGSAGYRTVSVLIENTENVKVHILGGNILGASIL